VYTDQIRDRKSQKDLIDDFIKLLDFEAVDRASKKFFGSFSFDFFTRVKAGDYFDQLIITRLEMIIEILLFLNLNERSMN
jgi:hypothetical protein